MPDYGLEGKVVLITGANHGIGEATAYAFAKEGATLFLAYYRPPNRFSEEELAQAQEDNIAGMPFYYASQQQPAERIAEQINVEGGEATAMEIDLSIAENITTLFTACEDKYGRVDVLVANHAHDKQETFDPALVSDGVAKITAESIDYHFEVNTRAVALLIDQYAKRYLARDGQEGSIVTLTTETTDGHIGNVSYSASKAALENYSTGAAYELGKYGIRINIVALGPTQTGWIEPEFEEELVARTTLGRLGEPDDIADVIVFLSSQQARWITAEKITVRGGFG